MASAGFCALAACGSGSPPEAPEQADDPAAAEVHAEDYSAHEHEEADADADHDHDHEADGAGRAHVHGIGELALTWSGNTLTAEVVAPLANYGLSESEGVFTDEVKAKLPGLVSVTGGDCAASAAESEVDTSSGHADGHVHISWTCAKPQGVSAVTFTGFTDFTGFEKVSAIYITDTDQKAGELSPSAPALSLK
jgi:hypothetical protein